VQLEELLLERYGWLERKADFSYLLRPVAQAFARRWSAAVETLSRQLAAADRAELVWLVQIVGTLGVAIVFLVAAVGGAQPSVVLPLLGGAVLFPFLVWGLRLTVRALGPAWLLRLALAAGAGCNGDGLALRPGQRGPVGAHEDHLRFH
jgi:uncharacterized integral membrane protein